jgi:hypothetical protein
VQRPTQGDGQGYQLTGHHEIMFPLLCVAVLEELRRNKGGKPPGNSAKRKKR